MPPWLPEPGYGDFAGRAPAHRRADLGPSKRGLAPARRKATQPNARRPPAFDDGVAVGPARTWSFARPSRSPLPADGPDVFWNFILSPSIPATRYVKAVEIRPGNARASITPICWSIGRGPPAARRRRRRRLSRNGSRRSRPTTFDPDSHFLFWKPGGTPRVEPDGMAWRLDPGNDLVLNVHLQPSGKPEMVQPSVGLYFTDKPPTKRPMLVQARERSRARHSAPVRATSSCRTNSGCPLDVDVLGRLSARALPREAAGSVRHAAGRLAPVAHPHSAVGCQLASRLPDIAARVPAEGHGGLDALSLRQLGRQSAQSEFAPETRAWAATSLPMRWGTSGCRCCPGRRRRAARFAGERCCGTVSTSIRTMPRRISISARCCSAATRRAAAIHVPAARPCAWRRSRRRR